MMETYKIKGMKIKTAYRKKITRTIKQNVVVAFEMIHNSINIDHKFDDLLKSSPGHKNIYIMTGTANKIHIKKNHLHYN